MLKLVSFGLETKANRQLRVYTCYSQHRRLKELAGNWHQFRKVHGLARFIFIGKFMRALQLHNSELHPSESPCRSLHESGCETERLGPSMFLYVQTSHFPLGCTVDNFPTGCCNAPHGTFLQFPTS